MYFSALVTGFVLVVGLQSTPAFGPAVLDGTVRDEAGVLVDESRVVLIEDGQLRVEQLTGPDGAFRFEVAGSFEIEVTREGFRSLRTTPSTLSAGAEYAVELVLSRGSPTDVETTRLLLSGAASAPGPAGPGVRPGVPRLDRLFGLRGGINVSGIAEGSTQQWIAASGSVFASSPSARELIELSDFPADYDLPVDLLGALPPGRDQVHGEVYYFHRNDLFNARNYFDAPDQPIPPFKYHAFGAELGGRPFESTYVYSRYWGIRSRQSLTRVATVPDPALLGGDFSSRTAPLIDPETGFAFDGNIIPPDRMHPEGIRLASLYPAPNVDGATVGNYRAVGKLDTVADGIGVRVDHRIGAADEASLEYRYDRDTTEDPFNLVTGITNLPRFGVRDSLGTSTFRVSNTHVFNALVIHQFDAALGLVSEPRAILADTAVEAVIVPGYSSLGHATNLPQERRNRTIEVSNRLSWIHDSASTRLGGSFGHFELDAFMDLLQRGQFQFSGGAFTGDSLANLLVGVPIDALRIDGDTERTFRTWTGGAYIQHDRSILPNLEVNVGLRYDYQSPYQETSQRAATFDEDASVVVPGRLYSSDPNNWGPRIGLAWSPFRGVVARAGYGVFFDRLAVGDSLFMLGLNPPFVRFELENNDPVLPRFDLSTVFNGARETIPPSVFSAAEDLANPYVQQWNLNVAATIGGFGLSVGYTGQKGTHLRRQINLNQPTPGPAVTLDERRPYSGYRNIFKFETSASSIGHAFDLRAGRRLGDGIQFEAAYRLSRLIDDGTLISILPQDSRNLGAERGLSDLHASHRATLAGIYDVPYRAEWFPGDGTWQIEVSAIAQSGSPLSAILGSDVAGTGSPVVNRPDLVGDPTLDDPTPERFFNTEAFAIPEPGTFGTSPRNVITGPGLFNVDMAVSYGFRIGDRLGARLRSDFFNAFNHPNFIAPPPTQNFADSPEFGALFVARSPRIIQLGMQIFW
jgi:hypothetical protein